MDSHNATEHASPNVRTLLVLGGGSAGFLAAMTVKRKLPELRVQLLRSPEIGIIGVGEGSTTYLPEHLHGYLGIPVGEFLAAAQPSWKLGVRFFWGTRELFYYPFVLLATRTEAGLSRSVGFYAENDLTRGDLITTLMHAGKAFARDSVGAPIVHRMVAYHLENEQLAAYLEATARQWGVEVLEDTVTAVVRRGDTIEQLIGTNGRTYSADFFIDCSGFRSRLLGQELAEPFESFESTLFCDRAIVGGWDRTTEPILPYTTSYTQSSGWMWQIEHEQRIHRGYVYSSAFQSDEAAEQEYRTLCPNVQNTRVVPFRSGAYRRSWVGNVVALGNAAGFVEPLEATALYVICAAAQAFTAALNVSERRPDPLMQQHFNDYVTRIWQAIRRFLAIHYRFNRRLETPFWRAAQHDVNLVDAAPLVEYYQEYGPDGLWSPTALDPVDPFRLDGYWVLLQGLGVPYRRRYTPSPAEQQRWQALQQEWSATAQQGLTVAEALRIVRLPQWRWHAGFYG